MRSTAAIITLALLLAPARAETPADAEARRLYQDGTKAYNLGDYADAIAAYKEAYRLVANPFFLYNIGQAHRLSGDLASAGRFYKSFLNALPEAPNRAEVEERIRQIDDALARQARERSAEPTDAVELGKPRAKIPPPDKLAAPAAAAGDRPPPRSAARPVYRRWWFWAGLGVVAAGATALLLTQGGGSGAPDSDHGTRELFP